MNPLYAEALKLAENQPATPSAILKVAKATSDEAARWAFGQWSLRRRGLAKFSRAMEMLFDQEGLEMATHEALAAYHASLFPSGEPVCDLTVGLGGDLIALARRGPAVGFEINEDRAKLSRHNLAVHGLSAEVINVNAATEVGEYTVVVPTDPFMFADPARRSAGRRFTDASEFQPNPLLIINSCKELKLGVIKLSPMLPDDFLDSLTPRIEFVSFGGECREALAIFGSQVQEGRFAVQVETGSILPADDLYLEESEEPLAYLYEADPAAIRAHALGNLCKEFELVALSSSNGYLTGSAEIESPWLTGFRVLDFGRFDTKPLKGKLADLGSGTPTLKQRGTKLDLQKLQKQMILKGSRALEVAFYAVGNSVRQVILERLR